MAKGDNECIPYYEPGTRITAHCEAAVIGKRFVAISDPQQGPAAMGLSSTSEGSNVVISPCAADAKAFGVAAYDGGIGDKVGVLRGPMVVPVQAVAAIAAGEEVEVGAAGQATPFTTGIKVGLALDDIAGGATGPIALYV